MRLLWFKWVKHQLKSHTVRHSRGETVCNVECKIFKMNIYVAQWLRVGDMGKIV